MFSLFCKHNWEVKVNERIPSGYEQCKEKMKSMKNFDPESLFFTRRLVVMTCKKCGKVYKTTSTNDKYQED